jgi:hypothetical protein
MKKSILFFAFTIASALTSICQEESVLLRQPYRLKVAVDKSTTYEEDLPARPYLFPNNAIQIYPGETVFIEVEIAQDTVKSMRAVKQISDSAKTITVSFAQNVKNSKHEMMMLTVYNPFQKQLSYDAKIYLLKYKKWVDTDVIPVSGGLSGIEMWPDLIVSMALGNWQFK